MWRIREPSNALDLLSCYRGSMWPSAVMLHKNTVTVQPASSISVSIASHNYLLFLALLKYCQYKLCAIILDVSFFKILFSCSRFLTLAWISLLVNILQFSFSLSYTGPKFPLYTFLSKMFNCFLSLFVSVQVSDAYF